MNINITDLNSDLRRIESQIRELKAQLRSPWTKFMDTEQAALIDLKWEATQRYILRAHARGRFHLADHERCKEIVTEIQSQYLLAA